MKKKIGFKALALSLSLLLTVSVAAFGGTASAETVLPAGYSLIAKDGDISLCLNSDTTNFYVEDKATSKRIYAFWDDASGETVSKESVVLEMQSAATATIYDVEKKSESVRNTNAVCVKQGNFDIRTQGNGFYIDYNMKSSSIAFSLWVRLENGKLLCSVPADSIKESQPDRYRLLSISLLPYMIKGMSGTEGTIVLPDGCGELMNFSVERATAENYKKAIYGRDKTLSLSVDEYTGYDVNTPYIATVSNDIGVLCVPTEGAAIGYVNAVPAGKDSSYANAFFSFEYRAIDTATIGSDSSVRSQKTQVINDIEIERDITLEFSFIFKEAAVNRLAKLYGEYLNAGSKAQGKAENTAVFDIYCAVKEKKNFLGFSYSSTSVISEGDDILALSEQFPYSTINLKYATSQQIADKICTNLNPIGRVLSKKQLKSLVEQSAALYVNADPLTFSKNSFNANSFFSAAKTVYNAPAIIYQYRESTHYRNNSLAKSFMLKPSKLEGIMSKLAVSAKKQEVGLSSDTLGGMIYNDYSVGGDLQTAADIFETACADFVSSGKLMLNNPADYTYKYLSVALDIPTESSNDDACSGDYPFLQIALGDSITYTVEAVNLYRSPEKMFLKSLITGSALHYSYVLSDTEPLKESELNFLYSADWNYFNEITEKQMAEWLKVREITEGSALADYIENSDRKVTAIYENGTKVTVDFENMTYKVSGGKQSET